MSQLIRESSGKGEATNVDKPPPGRARWRKPKPKKETFSGNDRSPKWEPPHTPPNNIANQQLRDKLAKLRRMVLHNAYPQARPLFRITYQKPYPEYIDEHNPFPLKFKMPAFPTFSGKDSSVPSRDHIFKFSNHCVAFEDNSNYKLRLFGNSLVCLAF
ncbi:hypothetical protein ACFX13_013831 [Malus domestica]